MHEIHSTGGAPALVGTAARRSDLSFAALTAAALLITHAIAFFLHEWSHSTTAWLLGFKAHPLAIYYGYLDLSNVLLQQEMDENVDYKSIVSTGHRIDVTIIALGALEATYYSTLSAPWS
jgi:hypothetical protein